MKRFSIWAGGGGLGKVIPDRRNIPGPPTGRLSQFPAASLIAAIMVVAAAALMRLGFLQALGTRASYVTFYPAVMLAALFGGLPAGLLATVLSALLADFFWIEPAGVGIADPADWLGMAIFLVSGTMISGVTEAMHRARTRAREAEIQANLADARQREMGAKARLAAIVESSEDAIVSEDLNGTVLSWNAGAERTFGYRSEEIIGKLITQIMPPECLEVEERILQRLARGERVDPFETVRVAKDGRRLEVSVAVSPLAESDGRLFGASKIVRDITGLKQAEVALRRAHDQLETRVQERTAELKKITETLEAERRRFSDVLDVLPAYVVLLSPDYYVPFANRFFRERFGESHGQRCFEYLFKRSEPCEICETYTVLKTRTPHHWEWTGPDGRNYDIFDFPFTDADGSTLIMEVGLDITERKQAEVELAKHRHHLEELVQQRTGQLEAANGQLQREIAERKRAEDDLRKSQEDLNRAQAVAHTGSWRLNVQRDELLWSDETYRIFGIPKGTPLTYERFLDAIQPEDRQYVDQKWTAALRGEPYDIEHRIVVGETLKWVRERAELEFDKAGGLLGGFGTVQDITERKRAEEKIRHQNAVLEGINRLFQEALACETEEQIGRLCLAVAEQITGSKFGFVAEINAAGRLDDIAISDPGWAVCGMANPTGHRTVPTDLEIHGLFGRVVRDSKGFFTNDPAAHPDSIGTPEGHPQLRAFLGVPLIQHGQTIGMVAVGNREGGYRAEDLAALEALAEPIVQVLMRRRAEQALRESEMRFRAMAETVPNILFTTRPDGSLDYLNQRGLDYTGLPAQSVRGDGWLRVVHPQDLQPTVRCVTESVRTGQPYEIKQRLRGADGAYRWFIARARPIHDKSGRVVQWLGATTEIDAMVRMQQELSGLNARLALLAETASQLLKSDSPQTVVDALCQKVLAFLDCQAFFNYLVDDAQHCLHLNACSGIPEEEARKIERLDFGVAVCGCVARDGCRIVAENIKQTPDPRTELVKSYGIQAYACHPLISQGLVLGTLSFGTRTRTHFLEEELSLMKAVADQVAIAIARMRAQQALQRAKEELEQRVAERTAELREKSRFLEAFFQHSMDSLVFLDPRFNFIRVNEAYAKASQRDVSEFPGHNHFEFYPHAENQAIFEEVVRTLTPYQVAAKPFVFPDHPEWGVTYWDWTLFPVRDAQGAVDFLVFSLRDVTQRERAEQEVRAASRYARSLIEVSLDPLVTISPQGKITDVNKATELVTGVSRDRLVGSDFSDYFTEPDTANAGYQKVIAEGWVRDYPLTLRHAAGGTIDVLYNATVYRNQAGQVQGVFAAARDITERKRFERALWESEQRYRSLVLATTQIVWTTNAQGAVENDMPAWRAFTGQTEAELKGWGWSQALHPEDRQRTQAIWTHAVQTRTLYQTEYRLRRHDGQYRYVAVRGVPVLETDGRIREWVGTCTDITEVKVAEQRQKLTNRLLELFARKGSRKAYLDSVVEVFQEWTGCRCLGIRVLDQEQNIPYESFAGFSRDFWELENWLSLQKDTCACIRVIQGTPDPQDALAMTPGGSFHLDNSLQFVQGLSPDEQTRYRGNCIRSGFTSLACIPIRYRDQALGAIHLADERPSFIPLATVEFIESMTPLIGEAIHRFNAEEALREQAALLDLAHDAIIVRDPSNRIAFWSQGAEETYGWTRAEALGKMIHALLQTQFPQPLSEILNSVAQEQKWEGELVHTRRDGSRLVVASRWASARDKEGRLAGILEINRDITQRKQAEAELIKYREHLEELVQQRTEELARSNQDLEQFAYVASHDLQEPLRAVAGFAGLLQRRYEGQLDDKAREYITGTVDGATRMQALINDLLAYSRISRGKTHEPVSAQTALDNALRNLRASIQETGAAITSDPLPTVWAEPVQLAQLFQNLIGNAIKFRAERPPKIQIRVRQESGGWQFAIQDNGIGIEPQYANRIFLIFQRLHNRSKYPGTGIGLAICKKIVDRHGGKIWVESQFGQGSTFNFTIPAK